MTPRSVHTMLASTTRVLLFVALTRWNGFAATIDTSADPDTLVSKNLVAEDRTDTHYRRGLAYLQGIGQDRKIREGVKHIVAAARSGHAPARTYLGELYTTGLLIPYEPESAFRLFLKSADENHVAAYYAIAQCYQHGIGVDVDQEKAAVWFQRTIQAGADPKRPLDSESMRAVGLCYRDGTGAKKSDATSAMWLLKAAKAGNPRALFELANFYVNGIGVPQNDRKAFALYLKSAHAGFAQACLSLSHFYRYGKGVAANADEADLWAGIAGNQFKEEARLGDVHAQVNLYMYKRQGIIRSVEDNGMNWLTMAADKGYPKALALLGSALATGNGITRDSQRAIRVLRQAAAANDGSAHFNLFQLTQHEMGTSHNPQAAWEHLRLAADAGNIQAMQQMAKWVAKNPNSTDPETQAHEWLVKARKANQILAELNQPQAQLALFVMLGRGQGGEKDISKAFYWLQRAAENGTDEAQFMLANAYDQGLGVERDPAEALIWYHRAAGQEFVPAILALGAACEYGELGLQRHAEAAERWYKKAYDITRTSADDGNVDAAYLLVTLHKEGLGVAPNPSHVMHWLHRAAELGHDEAQMDLYERYSRGRGVIKDANEALYWLQMAAESWNPRALFMMGRMYDEGNVIERDYVEASMLYSLSAQQGYKPAQEILEELEVTVRPQILRQGKAKAQDFVEAFGMASSDAFSAQ